MKPVTFGEEELKRIFRPHSAFSRGLLRLQRAAKVVVVIGLVYFGFFLLINGPAFWLRAKYQVDTVAPVAKVEPIVPVAKKYAPTIVIDKIKLKAPVVYGAPYSAILTSLQNGVAQYEGTALPNQRGNVVLLGHSSNFPWAKGKYNTIFALLDKLKPGDNITLYYGTERYRYTVRQVKVVAANDLSVLNITPRATVTLISCYPVGTTWKRIVVTGALTGGEVTGRQTTEPYLGNKGLPKPR
ncbi:hypothetical protein A3A71_02360 [Candidatus Berkelbacteria bacterium RIFCSPLOWO2_01_FULL_50_28]|uniref:Sortase n=1 Tax=Candidatus Berkelbacteria bacterium RIFCSPLOWO2_01_FULL_50_28 TaxID=1797471 RepID=A0A1F5EBS9_9BACT|nr:MAG: hypothetical protein A2807_00755 [Candidatus Berkelbacteria bacterium RIFCSPHIGHO2_01_FULL_50_36]OGD62225.1 MAG: hypothetical protein A3F39_00775 [Candidatus Berkelbacteria bacterium RIFCSPHIGHO2_12_FULL_50_11]OGD64867.1 MAG: hypothetical protein A3A71_02360 [Candidatus Berkelbacteria bacterium RIFCSPLOWO2_01_FULL_50_28]